MTKTSTRSRRFSQEAAHLKTNSLRASREKRRLAAVQVARDFGQAHLVEPARLHQIIQRVDGAERAYLLLVVDAVEVRRQALAVDGHLERLLGHVAVVAGVVVARHLIL